MDASASGSNRSQWWFERFVSLPDCVNRLASKSLASGSRNRRAAVDSVSKILRHCVRGGHRFRCAQATGVVSDEANGEFAATRRSRRARSGGLARTQRLSICGTEFGPARHFATVRLRHFARYLSHDARFAAVRGGHLMRARRLLGQSSAAELAFQARQVGSGTHRQET